jgi:hypothetical protein
VEVHRPTASVEQRRDRGRARRLREARAHRGRGRVVGAVGPDIDERAHARAPPHRRARARLARERRPLKNRRANVAARLDDPIQRAVGRSKLERGEGQLGIEDSAERGMQLG